jgi:hypothetical protein
MEQDSHPERGWLALVCLAALSTLAVGVLLTVFFTWTTIS